MEPVLIIMCGLPYSGSADVSRALVDELPGTVLVDVDAIMTERGFGGHGEPVPMMEWSTTYQVAYERLTEALSEGTAVVFEAGNYSKAQRDVLRMQARKAGAETAVVYLVADVEESRRRWQDADRPMEEFEFERAISRFESPGPAERVVMYLPGMEAGDLATGLRQLFGQ